jgi:hypothetical protein
MRKLLRRGEAGLSDVDQIQKNLTRPEQIAIVAASVLAGFMIAAEGVKHLFVEGLEDKERKGLLQLATIGLTAWGMSKLIDLDEHWYLTIEGVSKKLEEEASK